MISLLLARLSAATLNRWRAPWASSCCKKAWFAESLDDRINHLCFASIWRPSSGHAGLGPGASMRLPMNNRLSFRALLSLALLLGSIAQAAPAVVDLQRHDGAVRVVAHSTLKADLRTTWDTLVGYEQLPDFVPDMRSSRMVRRDGDQVVVQQSGRAGLGPFKRDFSLTLLVSETPMQEVKAHVIEGDFVRFESNYRLLAAEGGTYLEYSALIEPKDGIPPLVGVAVMRGAIERQFEALLAEIERRAAKRASGG